MESRFIFIPEDIAEKHRLRHEAVNIRKAKWDREHRPNKPGQTRRVPYRNRTFIVWDGEGPRDTGYSLLGNSEGEEICYPRLSTRDCLDLILQSAADHPGAIHVSFGFTYDVSCMLHELSLSALNRLYKFNRTYWKGYVIEHIPRKWVVIKKGDVRCKIFDIQSFFGGSLVSALARWRIGNLPWDEEDTAYSPRASQTTTLSNSVPTAETVRSWLKSGDEASIIRRFKSLRGEFEWKDIEAIKLYMHLELKYSKILIEEVRNAFASAGYLPRSWHGPGAIARMAFSRHHIYDALTSCPSHVRSAAQYAFIAGRFELMLAGHVGRVYTADINSAYPWFCSQLPNLRRGTWRHTDKYEPGKFAVWHIRYEHRHSDGKCNRGGKRRSRIYELYPLPKRQANGNIVWGPNVVGWYWNPEAELVANDPDAEFLEGWVFDEDDASDRPFAWIQSYYDQRLRWKAEGNPAEYTLKLIINAVYGQLAQRVGWDRKNRKGPKTHQIEFAGWITSSCRAMVYRQALRCAGDLVSIDTDGITSTKPFTWLSDSPLLGGWKLEEFEDSIYWQSGIYFLKTTKGWEKARTRGIAKGTYTVDQLFHCLENNEPLKLTKKVFISYGLALNGQYDQLNTWRDEPHEFKMGGSGKRFHYKPGCPACRVRTIHDPSKLEPSQEIHTLALPTIADGISDYKGRVSVKHKLPWLDSPDVRVDAIDRYVLFDRNDLDPDEEWSLSYASD